MKLLDLIKERHSVRKFQSREVEQFKLDYILECARLAPSAVNYQPWKFFIIKDKKKQELLKQCYTTPWFVTSDCPYYIVACGNRDKSWKRRYDNKDHCDIDLAIAIEHICLAVQEQGLGTCWVCAFDPVKCKDLLQLPEDMVPIVILPIGYPQEEEIQRTSRKEIEEIIEYY